MSKYRDKKRLGAQTTHEQLAKEYASKLLLEQQISNTKFKSLNQKKLYWAIKNNDVTISSGPAGCVLPGTDIEIKYDDVWRDEDFMLKTYNLNINQLIKLKKAQLIDWDKNTSLYNESSFTLISQKYLMLTSGQIKLFNKDKKFTSKYLKMIYWIGFLDVNIAFEKVKKLRRKKVYFEKQYENSIFQNFNQKNIEESTNKIIFRILSPNWKGFSKQEKSRWCKEFWLMRGWNEQEALDKVSSDQKIQAQKFLINKKNKLKNYDCYLQNQKKYWINLGFNENEAKEKVKNRQTTFSLKKCIEKYGQENGQKIFEERQKKWRISLKNDWEIIKQKIKNNASPGHFCEKFFVKYPNLKNIDALLYFAKFYDINNNIEFYKIGITTRTIDERLSCYNKFLRFEILHEEKMNLFDCFYKEQYFLQKYKNENIKIDYKNFKSTECFSENILEKEKYNYV